MNKLSGGKITSSHSAIIEPALKLIKKAQRLDAVSKISLGIIRGGLRPAEHRIKFSRVKAGLKITVRGTKSIQDIYIFTDEAEIVESILQN